MNTYERILKYNRDPELHDWFKTELEQLIGYGYYHNDIKTCTDSLIDTLRNYKDEHNVSTVTIGISGGIDSALTATLFKLAGYEVVGVTMPINQKQEETDRGFEACASLGIEHINVDLTKEWTMLRNKFAQYDTNLRNENDVPGLKRNGNIRARLRMNFLYNLASSRGGFVASTDNFSELAAGFWTLHGDVGDVAPIQSLLKSWEVPAMADEVGVPESIVYAVPTDGLGISSSDEEQFGFTYLEFDIALLTLLNNNLSLEKLPGDVQTVFDHVVERVSSTAHKRANPLNLDHPLYRERFETLQILDEKLRSN